MTLLFTILTTIGIFWQASIFNGQLIEAQKVFEPIKEQATVATSAANTARDALTKAQRAFVFEKDILYGSVAKNGQKIWRGALRWENSGLTPTKTAMIDFVCASIPGAASIADPYALLRLPNVASGVWNVSRVFPPKGPAVAGQCEFDNDELTKAQKGEITEYVIAQITYSDIFDADHMTRFCELVTELKAT